MVKNNWEDIVKLEDVSSVQEAHFAVIINLSSICSEHSVQALKGGNTTFNYCGETNT